MILTGLKDRFWIIEVFVRDVVRPHPTLSLVERKDVWDQQFNCKNDVKPVSLTHGVELVILAEGSMGIYLDTANRARLFPGIINGKGCKILTYTACNAQYTAGKICGGN